MIQDARRLLEQAGNSADRGDHDHAKSLLDRAVDLFLDSGCDFRTDPEMDKAYREVLERAHVISMKTWGEDPQEVQEYEPTYDDLLSLGPGVATIPIIWDAADRPDRPCERLDVPDSALATYRLLVKGIRPRGEFETTPQYQGYRRQLASSLGIGTTKYRFELGVKKGSVLSYDADRAEFTVRIANISEFAGKSSSFVALGFFREQSSRSLPRVDITLEMTTLRIPAAPDVARRVKPLFAGYRYYVTGRVVDGPCEPTDSPCWAGGSPNGVIAFEVEEFIIARGPEQCVVARIPLSRTN